MYSPRHSAFCVLVTASTDQQIEGIHVPVTPKVCGTQHYHTRGKSGHLQQQNRFNLIRHITQTAMAASSIRTLLMFGPGAMSLNETYFASILSFISTDSGSQWALSAVRDIESHWPSLCEAIPKLQHAPGIGHAQKLAEWLRTGTLTPGSTIANLPNAILGPLVVIAQLVEYLRHVDSLSESGLRGGEGFQVPAASDAETVGCCLGTFSTLVVSSSPSWAQFCHNAAAVVRIVFVLGALSDAQDASDATGPSVSLIAFWRGGQSLSDLKKALEQFPEVSLQATFPWSNILILTDCGAKGIHLCPVRREQGHCNDIYSHRGCSEESPPDCWYYNQ